MIVKRTAAEDLRLRQEVYERLKLRAAVQSELEQMIAGSPARQVGRGAINNVVSVKVSEKSSQPIYSESHSVELLRLYECELDRRVICFYTQVPMTGVARILPNGRRHVTGATSDLLVIYTDRIQLEECKSLEWLEAKVADRHPDWTYNGMHYSHGPYSAWCADRGLHHRVWAPPKYSARYRSNLQAMHHIASSPKSEDFERVCREVLAAMSSRTRTARSLLAEVDGATTQHLIYLIAKQQLYAPLISQAIEDQGLPLGLSKDDMEVLDRLWLDQLSLDFADPIVSDPALNGSEKELACALSRLNRLNRMRLGQEPWNAYFRSLERTIAEASGRGVLSSLIPNFSRCGNRVPRTSPEQKSMISEYALRWQRGEFQTQVQATAVYKADCQERGIPAVSRTTLTKSLSAVDPIQRELGRGGLRAAQKVSRRSGPLDRTRPCPLVGHTIHIDATNLDVRGTLQLEETTLVDRGTVYVARDAHGLPLAASFIFGSQRVQGLALLYRDYVARNHELPTVVHMDRGPENESNWHQNFAIGRFTLSYNPTAAAKYNQPAEDLLNHINMDVSHWLKGNTLNDRWGRAVDGRFKSIRTAAIAYSEIFASIERYLFSDFGEHLRSDGVTYGSDYASKQEHLGYGGSPCEIDDDFLIATSCPIERWTSSESNGIRARNQFFLNRAMQIAFRAEKPREVLADCANPTLCWVRVRNTWYKALASGAAETSSMSVSELVARGWERSRTEILRRIARDEKKVARVLKARRAAESSANGNASAPTSSPQDVLSEFDLEKFEDIDIDEISGYREI